MKTPSLSALLPVLLPLTLLLATPAAHGDVMWTASSGDWSAASNWGGVAPGFADDAYIANGGTASITALDPNATCLGLYLGDTASGATGTLQMSAGNLSSTTVEYIGNLGAGTFNQSGGSHSANAISIGNGAASGIYTLGGSGILSANTVDVGYAGNGTFNQSGGTFTVFGALTVNNPPGGTTNGNFNLNAGSLWALNEEVAGVFSQSGGTHTVANPLTIDSNGSYTLGGGVLQSSGLQGGGAFSFSGGTLVTAPGFTADESTAMLVGGSGGYVNTSGGPATFAGALSGTAGLYVFGGGTLTLAGNNSFSGATSVSGNGTTLLLSNPNALQGSTLTLTSANVGLTFDTGGGDYTSFNLGGLSGYGNTSLVDGGGNALELVVGGNGANMTYNGVLSDGGAGGSLTKAGSGTLVLGGANAYSGSTSINGGALVLDFSQSGAPTSDIVNSSSSLVLGGGTLAVRGNASASNSQTFSAGLTVNPGASAVVATAGASGTLLLDVESISRMPGGTVDFTTSGGTITTSTATTNGILGGYATCGGTAWATVNASNDIVPLTSYATGSITGTATTSSGTANASPSGTQSTITSAITLNSLLLNGSVSVNMSGAGSLTLASGGLIGNTSGSISGGTLEGSSASSSNAELIVFTPRPLTISSVILDNDGPTALTKSGSATLLLTGSNTYSGVTTVNAGTLQIGNGGGAGSIDYTSNIVTNSTIAYNRSDNIAVPAAISGLGGLTQMGPGTLTLTGNNTYTGVTNVTGGTLQLGDGTTDPTMSTSGIVNQAALVYNVANNQTAAYGISGSGGLTLTGGGTLILSANNTYTGNTTISAGTIQLGNGGANGSLGTGPLTVNDTLVFNRSDNPTFSGVINGSGAVVQSGPGVLILTGTNNAAGGTVVSAGTLQVGNGGAAGSLGTGPANVGGSGLLAFNLAGSATVANVISGNGSLVQTGAGVLTLLAFNNSFTGDVTVAAGTLQIGNGGSGAALPYAANVEDDGSLVFNHGDNVIFGAAITGSGGLTQTGSGYLVLTGANNYTGGTTISGGTLQVGHGGSGAAISGAGGVLDNGTLVFSHNDLLEVDGNISGGGSLIHLGVGTLVLGGSNTYSGATTISFGTIQIGNGGAGEFLTSPSVTVATPATALAFSQSDSMIYGGAISGAGNVAQAGPGTVILTGNNTYSGSTTISGGTLQVGTGSGGGSLGSGPALDNGNLTFNLAGPLTYSGAISGSGSLTQAGAGALTLLGNNTLTGNTSISAGTIQLGNGGASGSLSGPVNIGSLGTLVLDRSDNASMGLSVNGPGTLVKTANSTVTLTGNSSRYSGAIDVARGELVLAGPASMAGSTVNSGGTLQFSGASSTLQPSAIVYAQSGAAVQFQNTSVNFNGGGLYGPGAFVVAGSTTTTLTDATIGGTLLQSGPATFTGVTNNGLISATGGLLLNFSGYNMGNGTLALSGTNSSFYWGGNYGGIITIAAGGVLNNSGSNLTSWDGGVITVAPGGTLNTASDGQGESLNLRESLLINDGQVPGTTNVGFAAVVTGTGSFGTINVSNSGQVDVAPSGMQAAAVTVGTGLIQGGGTLSGPIAITTAAILTPSASQTLTLPGNLSGSGELIDNGPGSLVLSGTNSYGGGTLVEKGTLTVTSAAGLQDGSNLIVGLQAATAFGEVAPDTLGAGAAPEGAAAAVPEPSALVLLVAAGAAAAVLRACRRTRFLAK